LTDGGLSVEIGGVGEREGWWVGVCMWADLLVWMVGWDGRSCVAQGGKREKGSEMACRKPRDARREIVRCTPMLRECWCTAA
jgi:hypothetical protein